MAALIRRLSAGFSRGVAEGHRASDAKRPRRVPARRRTIGKRGDQPSEQTGQPLSAGRAHASGASSQSAARAAPCGGAQRSRLDAMNQAVSRLYAYERPDDGDARTAVWQPLALPTV